MKFNKRSEMMIENKTTEVVINLIDNATSGIQAIMREISNIQDRTINLTTRISGQSELESTSHWFDTLTDGANDLLSAFSRVGSFASSFKSIYEAVKLMKGVKSSSIIVKKGATAAKWLLNAAKWASPIFILVGILAGIIIAIQALIGWWNRFNSSVDESAEVIENLVESYDLAEEKIERFINNLVD